MKRNGPSARIFLASLSLLALTVFSLNALSGAAFVPTQGNAAQTAAEQQDAQQVSDIVERLGPFTLAGKLYGVVLRKKMIETHRRTAPETLAELDVVDANGSVVYHETLPYEVGDGVFTHGFSAAVGPFAGAGGTALAIRFREEPPSGPANESYQVLGIVNGKLGPFGPPLPLGQTSSGTAAGGVLAGVMVRGGVGVVPLASTADLLEFRVWEGNFYVEVPVNVDWGKGEWSEGEQCFELAEGTLRPKGCNLKVRAVVKPVSGGASYARMYPDTNLNPYSAQQLTVRPDSRIDCVQVRAIVKWQASGDRFSASFEDVWLQVRIDGKDGWVNGEQDLAAIGLPAGPSPAPVSTLAPPNITRVAPAGTPPAAAPAQ